MMKKILLIEDSRDYQIMLESVLQDSYKISIAENGEMALAYLTHSTFDLAIIDIILPDMSGLQICNYIKSQKKLNEMPVILLTSKDTIDDKIQGLNCGADDYMIKPFDCRELKARIRNQLRRNTRYKNNLHIQGLEIDQDKQRVLSTEEQRNLELTRIEYKLLICFGYRVDHVLSRQQILDLVWPNNLSISERTVDSHISNLRKKLSKTGVTISAVHGSGYRFHIEIKAS